MLDGYTNTNMSDDIDSTKSTSGYSTTFIKGVVSWQSKLQKCVALWTIELDYVTIVKSGSKELLG